jgi:hypothetical protein
MNIFNVDEFSFFMSSILMLNYCISNVVTSNVNMSIAPRFAISMLIKTMNLLGVIWFNT